MELWNALREIFGGISLTKFRSLTIKFDTYKKRLDHIMKKYLRDMSNMISELNDVSHMLTEEPKIQAVIHSLPNSWEHMRMHLTHLKNIRNFKDDAWHLELEEDRLVSVKVNAQVHYAQGRSSAGTSSNNNKYKNQGKGKAKRSKKKSKNIRRR